MDTLNTFKKLMELLKTTNHKDLKAKYNSETPIYSVIKTSFDYIIEAQTLLSKKFSCFSEEIRESIDRNRDKLEFALLLQGISQLEGRDKEYKDEELLNALLKKYLGDEFETIDPIILKMVYNKRLKINDEQKVQDLLAKENNEFVWLFSAFLIARCWGMANYIKEFNDIGKDLNNGNNYPSPNFTFINMFIAKKFSKYLSIIETLFGDNAKEGGKEFTGKVILVNKVFNDEIATPLEEEMTMADVGGGDSATKPEWGTSGRSISALASPLFGKPLRRAYPKSLGVKVKKKKMKTPIGIISTSNFNMVK